MILQSLIPLMELEWTWKVLGIKEKILIQKKTGIKKIPDTDYFDNLFRISKNQIIFGGNYFPLHPSRCFVIWDKGSSFKDRTFAECEMAWTSFDRNAKIFSYDPIAKQDYKNRIHQTQKPVSLYKWLLHNFAKDGDKILDTHGGSMSSAIACGQMNFDITLCELDLDYFTSGCQRVLDYFRAQNLFAPQPEIKINGLNAE